MSKMLVASNVDFCQHFFNFGCVKIETAGEQANFIFNFCPNPNGVAKIILDAKDDFLIATGQSGLVWETVYDQVIMMTGRIFRTG